MAETDYSRSLILPIYTKLGHSLSFDMIKPWCHGISGPSPHVTYIMENGQYNRPGRNTSARRRKIVGVGTILGLSQMLTQYYSTLVPACADPSDVEVDQILPNTTHGPILGSGHIFSPFSETAVHRSLLAG